ncbi:hypothetical protein ACB094_11G141300 [Castanea mollissima]
MIQDLINQDLRSLYVSLISHLERGDVKLLQDHLHIIRDNDTIDIESYGKLTLSSIASDIHKIVGWRHQLNVTVSLVLQTHYQVAQPSCLSSTEFHFTARWLKRLSTLDVVAVLTSRSFPVPFCTSRILYFSMSRHGA